MTARRRFNWWTSNAVTYEFLAVRASPGILVWALLLNLLAPLVGRIQAQTFAPIRSAASNTAKLPQETQAYAPPAAQTAYQAIPLPLIADRAEELDYLLREINSELAIKENLLNAEKNAEKQEAEIRRRALQLSDLLVSAPIPLELRDEERYWHSRSQEYGAQRKLLRARAARLEDQVDILNAQQPVWQATRDHIHGTPGMEAIAERIQQQLDEIQVTRLKAREQLKVVLTLQNQVAQQDQQISDALFRMLQFREQERRGILEPDSPPLWAARESRGLDQATPIFHSPFDRSFTSAQEFLRAHKFSTFILVITYVLSLLGVLRLRRYLATATHPDIPQETLKVLEVPFSAALLVALIGTGEYIASAPLGIAFIFYLLYLVPVLRIFAPLVAPRSRVVLYVLAVFYALEGLYMLVQLPLFFRRELYSLLVLAALVSLGWLARPSRARSLLARSPQPRFVIIAIRTDILLLAASLVANIVGLFSLSQILGITALVGPFLAAALYCGVRALTLILTAVLHTPWMRALLEAHVNAVGTWSRRLLVAGASLLWLKTMLQLLTVYDTVMAGLSSLLQRPVGFEIVHFTLAGTLSIVLILIGGYVFANVAIFLLRKTILSRLPLHRGVPYAVSRITYYFFLLLICLAALSAARVELNKFTVLTGALGVGLGFGLQNIVNNFVSGLILLFERPIHVGDTVDVGGLEGTVRRIGARSSTVLTFQGAEVIVPNSNLLSNQVINWTLSSEWRRVDVPVGVAYGTDPEQVIKLLVAIAESHPGVLLQRPPMAFFLGFGESALKFELRFWCARNDAWFKLQSDVTIAVAKALRQAGIEIPFPQRDLHVRSIGTSAADTLATSEVRPTSSPDPGGKERPRVMRREAGSGTSSV